MRVSTAKKTIKKTTILRIYKIEITTLSPSNCYYYYQPTNKQAKIMKSNHHHPHIAKNAYERRASTTKEQANWIRPRVELKSFVEPWFVNIVINSTNIVRTFLLNYHHYPASYGAPWLWPPHHEKNICSIEPLSYQIKSNANYLHCQPSRPSPQSNQLQRLNKTNPSRKTKTIYRQIRTLQSSLSVNSNAHKQNVRKLPDVGQRY